MTPLKLFGLCCVIIGVVLAAAVAASRQPEPPVQVGPRPAPAIATFIRRVPTSSNPQDIVVYLMETNAACIYVIDGSDGVISATSVARPSGGGCR